MDALSRRDVLVLTAAGGAAVVAAEADAESFGNPDRPPQGAVNASPRAAADPGPANPAMAGQLPSFHNPPPTDVGDMPMFWASFNAAARRIQGGGWARQVTAESFPISKAISGVNMRLGPGGIRELHWHLAGEWGLMTYGRCRVTVFDASGRAYVEDVGPGDIWYFPSGYPHSLQGLGDDGCEFLIVFDDGHATEFNTLPLTDWIAHTPPDVLALNFGVPAEVFRGIPLNDLWIFQGAEPGPLERDRAAAGTVGPGPFTFALGATTPVKHSASGEIRLADSRTFKASTTIAAVLQTIRPGGMRQMHWHPNADEWQYWLRGEGRMTVFNAGPRAQTADFRAGDVGYVPRSQGHYIQNTGTTDLEFLAVFRAPEYQEIDLSDWLAHTPPALVAQHLNIDPAALARFPKGQSGIVPG